MSTAGKPITCRAAVVWEQNQPYKIEIVEVSVPKNGEVRVKLTSSGICHTDSHFQEGMFPSVAFPLVLGHEGAGIIESVGEGVTHLKSGDLVVLTFEAFCGECDYCKNPNCNMCLKQPRNHLQMDGTSRMSYKGKFLSQFFSISTFSEYTVTSQWNVTKIDVLDNNKLTPFHTRMQTFTNGANARELGVNPKADRITLCLLGCCVPTGYGAAVNTAKVTPGSTCAIWGLGGVGMCIIMGCKNAGASKIIGIDINDKKFELAKELGMTHFLNPKKVSNIPEAIAKLTTRGADFCFVSVGVVPVMNEAFKSSQLHWGKTIIIGSADQEAFVKAGVIDLLFGRQLCGSWCGSYKAVRDVPDLVEKSMKGDIQLEKLVTHRLPLDKINEAYEMLKTGESLRAIIDFDMKA